jgi:hypothetical protein
MIANLLTGPVNEFKTNPQGYQFVNELLPHSGSTAFNRGGDPSPYRGALKHLADIRNLLQTG